MESLPVLVDVMLVITLFASWYLCTNTVSDPSQKYITLYHITFSYRFIV